MSLFISIAPSIPSLLYLTPIINFTSWCSVHIEASQVHRGQVRLTHSPLDLSFLT